MTARRSSLGGPDNESVKWLAVFTTTLSIPEVKNRCQSDIPARMLMRSAWDLTSTLERELHA